MPRALCVIIFSVYPLISETQKIGSGRLSKFMEPQFRPFSVSSPLTLHECCHNYRTTIQETGL